MATTPMDMSAGGGCGCKRSQSELVTILGNDLVNTMRHEDAHVLEDGRTVHSVDFQSPLMDDAYTSAYVAAANALSDVYAMGARPTSALAIFGYPDGMPGKWVRDFTRGGMSACQAAGIALHGGHTIVNPQPLYGLAVTGQVDEGRSPVYNSGAQPGDLLVLTKPLGVAAYASALRVWHSLEHAAKQAGRETDATVAWGDEDRELLLRVIKALNTVGAEIGSDVASAMTDVTGFGLLGHLREMSAPGLTLSIRASDVPVLPRALEFVAEGSVPGITYENAHAVLPDVRFHDGVTEDQQLLLSAPETNGGLLIAVRSDVEQTQLLARIRLAAPDATVIGRVYKATPGSPRIEVFEDDGTKQAA